MRVEKRALKDISRLQRSDQRRIVDFLKNRLARRDNPRELGEALTGPLAGLWKCRVGSFRILTRIDDSALAIWVVQVGDRREVYR
ncbi:type II toxin-antitoxin system RelE/ParE family toxin [Mesorhizobium sp.]|uniref:type II toxin-antitoxin system RelE family toxin n=1 Tax=Mesorhizobium sp. TaxID=1871066 RepID=UPI00338D76B2